MITGFNTDIEFEGVTYHVQTEDKGLSRPIILSLVYDRGTILASKRVPYDDLLIGEFDERILETRLQKQHKLFCAAVKAGRIEDLKRMTERDSKHTESENTGRPEAANDLSHGMATVSARSLKRSAAVTPAFEPDIPIPKPSFDSALTRQAAADEIAGSGGRKIEDEEIVLSAEAVAIVSENAGTVRHSNNKLNIEILGETQFIGGERKTISFIVCRGNERKVVGKAQIMVKILGTNFRPVIFHASTDNNGLADINIQLPRFNAGRAAFLVRAMSDGEQIELRRGIAHG